MNTTPAIDRPTGNDTTNTSWNNAGDHAAYVTDQLRNLCVPGVQDPKDGIVRVTIPMGATRDAHQDALTDIVNAIVNTIRA